MQFIQEQYSTIKLFLKLIRHDDTVTGTAHKADTKSGVEQGLSNKARKQAARANKKNS